MCGLKSSNFGSEHCSGLSPSQSKSLLQFRPPRRSPLSEDEAFYEEGECYNHLKRQKLNSGILQMNNIHLDREDYEDGLMHKSYSNKNSGLSTDTEDKPIYMKSRIPPEFLRILKDFRLFKNAPPAFFAALGKCLRLVQYRPQEYIVKRGETARSMYWILRGTVVVASTDGEAVYAELTAGSFFGEIGILFNRPRTATVVARTRVLLGILTKDSLAMVLGDFPRVERLIRDEAQERLVMQEKRKRASRLGPENLHLPRLLNTRKLPIAVKTQVNALNKEPLNKTLLLNSRSLSASGPSPQPMISHTKSVTIGATNSIDINRNNLITCSPEGNIDNSISTRDFLSSLPLFHGLPDHIFHILALRACITLLKPMQYVIHRGNHGRDIFFVIFGAVEVVAQNGMPIARLGPKQYFGEMSYAASLGDDKSSKIIGTTRTADVRAISDCEVLVIKASTLDDICKKYPFVFEEMKRTASKRLNENNNQSSFYKQSYPTGAIPFVPPKPLIGFNNFSFSGKLPLSSNKPQEKTLQMELPPYNPVPTPTDRFNMHYTQQFRYTPRDYRWRLICVNGNGRRRSSLLSTGPLLDSIFLKIFGYLDLPTLMRISRVCRRWKQMIYLSETLFKELDLRPWSRDLDDKGLIAITKFVGPRPEIINISNCFHITDKSFCYMINEIGISGCIRKIYMRDNWNISAMAIMDLSVACRQLHVVDLSNCRKVTDEVIERLVESRADARYGCHELCDLDLSYCKLLSDKTMLHLATNTSSHLRSLNLTRCTTITDNGYCFWSRTTFPYLKKLVLKDCTFISDDAISAVASACPNLEDLDLTFCCVLSDDAVVILSFFCKHLKSLNMSFCGSAVSDNSLISAASMTQLEKLIITGCIRVTREGVDTVVGNSQSIQYLNLSQCPNINTYRGKPVEPFIRIPGKRYTCLKVHPHERIVKVAI